MKRKIIKQKSAYTITLPIEWIRDNNLTGADEIEVTNQNNDLNISTSKNNKKIISKLELKTGSEHYHRILIENEYLKGCDIIKIKYSNQDTFKTIHNIVSNLIGFEIIEQKENYCELLQTAMPTEDEFSRILNRLVNIVKYLGDFVHKKIKENDFEDMFEIKKIISDIRRFSLFCRRTIHKKNIVTRTEQVFLDLLLERLVITSYHHYFMYEKINQNIGNDTISKKVIDFYLESFETYNLFLKMFFKQDSSSFDLINQMWEKIYFKTGPELLLNVNKKESIIIFHSMNYAYETFLMAQPNTTQINIPKII
ncbi:MAG: hypothetical protein HRU03_00045 [Nanoarchaeales archaeon]|nr:hypothetical protein [Nanoarchaeales archaeon]